MTYEVEIEDRPALRVAVIAHKCGPDDYETEIEQTLTDVWGYLEGAATGPAGPPFSLLLDLNLDTDIPPAAPWRLRSGFPVVGDVRAAPPIKIDTLPAGRVATTVHQGEYDDLMDALLAVQVHIQASGLEVAGPPWTVYLTDPVREPDPGNWRTQICWPLRDR
jgi:AraC family transcriptional regulator